MSKKYPMRAARGGFSLTNFTSKVAYQLDLFSSDSIKPQIRSIGITQPCGHCGCKRGYLFKGKILCCRCDRPVTGGSN
jgi:hypothetical protein